MRGRRPKPSALKVLQGNPGHRKIDLHTEPQPVIGLGAPPAHLDADARIYWFSNGPELVKLGTLGESDAPLFAVLCEAHSRNLWLAARIQKLRQRKRLSAREERQLEKYERGRISNAAQFQKIGAEFGMGAASRTRIRIKPNDGQGELPLGDEVSPLHRAMAAARSS